MVIQTTNPKLIESLLQAIAALSVEEQNMVRSRLLQKIPTSHPQQAAIDILTAAPS